MAAMAIEVPMRAVFMPTSRPPIIVRVHVPILYKPLAVSEQWPDGDTQAAATGRAGPAGLDAGGGRGDGAHHLDGVPAAGDPRPRRRRRAGRARGPPRPAHPGRPAAGRA